jgi:hypothetical protein
LQIRAIGLGAARAGNPNAPLIDGIAGWATGSITHPSMFGNSFGALDAGSGFLRGENTIMNGAQLFDTYSDGKGAIDGIKEPKR